MDILRFIGILIALVLMLRTGSETAAPEGSPERLAREQAVLENMQEIYERLDATIDRALDLSRTISHTRRVFGEAANSYIDNNLSAGAAHAGAFGAEGEKGGARAAMKSLFGSLAELEADADDGKQ